LGGWCQVSCYAREGVQCSLGYTSAQKLQEIKLARGVVSGFQPKHNEVIGTVQVEHGLATQASPEAYNNYLIKALLTSL